jgi:transcriptional regulator with XRE-family HTH domain
MIGTCHGRAALASRERPRDRALRHGHRLTELVGDDIRAARLSGGLSLRGAAASVGLSKTTFWRIEHNAARDISVRGLELACAAVGLSLSMRAYPASDPARDAGHLALLGRLRARLPAEAAWVTEVPMPIAGDLRALDARTSMKGETIGFEAETRLTDAQAVERKALLKKRDARLDRMILVVSDTRSNREFLARHREHLRSSFPLDTRAILAALALGDAPDGDGIVVL